MTPASDAIAIVHPVSDPELRRAAALRLARTRKSLDWLLRRDSEGIALFGDVHPEQMIIAVSPEGQPVGMITWSLDRRDVFRTSARAFAALYGPIGGRLRLGIYTLMGWAIAPRRGAYINTIWVDPAWRPRGAGTKLLTAAGRTILVRAIADIRAGDRRGRLLFGRQGMKPLKRGLWPRLVRLAGFERLERAEQPGAH